MSTRPAAETAVSREEIFKTLGLNFFSSEEIRDSFIRLGGDQIQPVNTIDLKTGLKRLLQKQPENSLDSTEHLKVIDKMTSLITGQTYALNAPVPLTLEQYTEHVTRLGESLDPRIWKLVASFLLTGTSVGAIIPCMPLLVQSLSIPASEFSLVIAAFGLSKLLGNIPCGYLVEKYGRKPLIVSGLGLCGVALGSIGLTLLPGFGVPWLIGCRFFSGLGVSAFVAGGFMYLADVSTPLNRTRTMAPVMAAFSGGAALGPALGGVLIDFCGISETYAIVGGLFGAITAMNYLLLDETLVRATAPVRVEQLKQVATESQTVSESQQEGGQERPLLEVTDDWTDSKRTFERMSKAAAPSTGSIKGTAVSGGGESTLSAAFTDAYVNWKVLMADGEVRKVVLVNGAFWFAFSGSQMTLLPLFMVSPTFNLTPYEIGGCFAFMSVVSFLCSQPNAFLADRYGKVPNILLGCGLISTSILTLPYASTLPEMVLVLVPLALGSTALNASPIALVADLVSAEKKGHAMTLLRTMGDLGLLVGASCSGLVAQHAGIDWALQLNGCVVVGSMAWFALRSWGFKGNSGGKRREDIR